MNEFTDCSLLLVKNYSSATVYMSTFVKSLSLLELTLSAQNLGVQSEEFLLLEGTICIMETARDKALSPGMPK